MPGNVCMRFRVSIGMPAPGTIRARSIGLAVISARLGSPWTQRNISNGQLDFRVQALAQRGEMFGFGSVLSMHFHGRCQRYMLNQDLEFGDVVEHNVRRSPV